MTPRLLGRVASESGLSEAKVKSGLGGAVASIFGGLAGKASDKSVMSRVTDLVSSSPDVDATSAFDDMSPLKASSNQLLGIATGDSSSLISRIASMLGVGGKAAGGIVAAASSLAIAAFKKLGRTSGGLDANKLANTLIDERQEINAHLPAGMATAAATTTTTVRDRGAYAQREEVERAPSRAWWWLVALIPLALLGYWLFNRSRPHEVRAPATTPPAYRSNIDRAPSAVPPPTTPAPATPPAPQTEPGARIEPPDNTANKPSMSAPDTDQPDQPSTEPGSVPTPPSPDDTDQPQHPGATPTAPSAGPRDTEPAPQTEPSAQLDFPAGSTEARFLEQVKSPSGADESTWFELDKVTFATGKAKLDTSSQEQIKDVADILKANPDVKVRVGGYTDATGSAAANKRLSQQRAEAVKLALVAQGVDATRIDTKGFGDQNKVVQTRGSEQANRRAAIRVLSRGE